MVETEDNHDNHDILTLKTADEEVNRVTNIKSNLYSRAKWVIGNKQSKHIYTLVENYQSNISSGKASRFTREKKDPGTVH